MHDALRAARAVARVVGSVGRRHWPQLLVLFLAILVPLWGFAELAEEVREGEAFDFDDPLLLWAQGLQTPGLDRFFVLVSLFGYAWGVVPLDVAIPLVQLALRRIRAFVFFTVSVLGSALLNMGAKAFYGRTRPSLWESIAPETTFSFPSGHAMGSMTLAAALVLLAWPTRWRWIALALGVVAVALVGFSRVYLGVHYPSDVVAGWAAGLVWTVGVHQVLHLFPRWRARPARPEHAPA
ncbi:phosphatase PAP2 family protein [Coralloluteibacterium stylophorae]|uniref:undecaprenyl-diphosphate phosphatase n=1 Tax=Coralloluteibacterium stylophorae TaxID=1776034 RepID=A0A8J7VT01_9GAMM|nr:phosphatase PAP2 family protein [Coralloluteibacterium stylophorae]MBS7455635.1 phosphatase PAP2 family protein [Coralloluteibacterium stylophorae]